MLSRLCGHDRKWSGPRWESSRYSLGFLSDWPNSLAISSRFSARSHIAAQQISQALLLVAIERGALLSSNPREIVYRSVIGIPGYGAAPEPTNHAQTRAPICRRSHYNFRITCGVSRCPERRKTCRRRRAKVDDSTTSAGRGGWRRSTAALDRPGSVLRGQLLQLMGFFSRPNSL